MLNKRFIIYFFAVFCFLLNAFSTIAAESDSTQKAAEYSLVVYAGGGVSYYSSLPGLPKDVPVDDTRTGFGASLRVMWHPDHLLRLGFETGRIPFYSYKGNYMNVNTELHLSAVPVMIVWSMPVEKRFNLYAGYGIYILTSKLDFGGEAVSKTNSLGYMLAANYIHPIGDNLGLAGEIKWMNANETKNDVLNFQVQLVWKFFTW